MNRTFLRLTCLPVCLSLQDLMKLDSPGSQASPSTPADTVKQKLTLARKSLSKASVLMSVLA
jgi:hypothetical protein